MLLLPFCWWIKITIWWKPGVSISPGLDSVAGRDTRTDRRTDRIPIANTRPAVPAGTAVARKNVIISLVSNYYTAVRTQCTVYLLILNFYWKSAFTLTPASRVHARCVSFTWRFWPSVTLMFDLWPDNTGTPLLLWGYLSKRPFRRILRLELGARTGQTDTHRRTDRKTRMQYRALLTWWPHNTARTERRRCRYCVHLVETNPLICL